MVWRYTLTDTTFGGPIVATVEEPEGWNGSKLIFKRDTDKHGVFRDYTLGDLGFHGQGYEIIKDAWDSKGIFATTTLLIEIQCADGGDYDTFYEGKLNYSKIKFFKGDPCRVTIGIEQTGCLMTFRNRYDQKVNLGSLLGYDGVTALPEYVGLGFEQELPAKDIFQETVWDDGEATDQQCDTFAGSASNIPFLMSPSLFFTKDDLKDSFNQVTQHQFNFTRYSGVGMSPVFDPNNAGYTLPVTVDVTYNFAGEWVDEATDGSGTEICGGTPIVVSRSTSATDVFLRMYIAEDFSSFVADPGVNMFNLVTIDAYIVGGGGTQTEAFTSGGEQTLTVTLQPGQKIWVFWEWDYNYAFDTGGRLIFTQNFDTKLFKLSASTEFPITDAKVFLINEALSRTTEIITDDCMRVYSDYFGRTDSEPYNTDENGCGSNEFITSGLLIRRALLNDGSEPQFTVSFKHLFEGLNAIHCIGIGIEDDDQRAAGFKRIRVEPTEYFYNDTVGMICENVREITIKCDEKRIYSNIEVGYKKWEPDEIGGRDDFHSKRTYRTEQDAVSNTLTIQSDFIASNYSAEITRRIGTGTRDWKYDNDTFIYVFERTVYGTIDVQADFLPNTANNILAIGILYFNQRITPVRNLLHWFKVISPSWSKDFLTELRKLHFTSGEGNYIVGWLKTDVDDCVLETTTDLEFGLLYENQDVDKTTFKDYEVAKPLWHPEVIEFEYPMTYTQFRTIRLNPYRLVKATQGANEYHGWILNLEYDPNEGVGKFELLMQYTDNY